MSFKRYKQYHSKILSLWTLLVAATSLMSPAQNVIQSASSYRLTVKDEHSVDIGSYFDIGIDSLQILSDTTINFQMIPNLGIQNNNLREKYSTFLEMVKRNTGKEPEYLQNETTVLGNITEFNRNWGTFLPIFIGDEYDGHDDWVREVIAEFNTKLGFNYFIEVQTLLPSGWNFNYSNVEYRKKRDIKKQIQFYTDGRPKSCIFYPQGKFHHPNDFKSRLRQEIVRALLLYSSPDWELIETGDYDSTFIKLTTFSNDLVNVFKLLIKLPPEHCFQFDQNEFSHSPVARIDNTGEQVHVGHVAFLDGSSSSDPDGYVVSYHWQQLFQSRNDTSYMTSNVATLNDTSYSMCSFIPNFPGNYRFKLTIKDNSGNTDFKIVDIPVYPKSSTLAYKGLDFSSYWDVNYKNEFIDPDLSYILSKNVQAISFVPLWWMENLQSTDIHPLGVWGVGAHGFTVSDDEIKNLISKLKTMGVKVILKPAVAIYDWASWQGYVSPNNWNDWFESYKKFITHYAMIAESLHVDAFVVGAELKNSNVFENNWRDVIFLVRKIYKGRITYQDAEMFWGLSSVKFWDALDYIGFSFYFPGSGDPMTSTAGINDPLLPDIINNLNIGYRKQAFDCYLKYRKPILILETGCTNYDGANTQPWMDQILYQIPPGTPMDNREQSEYYEAMMQFVQSHVEIEGIFFFVYNLMSDYTYQVYNMPFSLDMRYQPAMEVLKHWYK